MTKILPFVFVFLLSIFVIFFQFNEVPKNLSFDEVEFGRLARSLDGKPYQPYSSLATGHSTLYFYIILFSFKVFGVNNFGLRFPAALFGVLSVLFFYLIIKKVFHKQASLFYVISSVIFLSSRWFFNFARFSFEATFLLFLELASIYFLFLSSKWSLILSGFFAGLAFNSYTPGRIFFLLPLFSIVVSSWKVKQTLAKNLLFFLIPFIIVIAPLSLYLLRHQDARVDRLLFWKNREMTVAEKISGTWQNMSSISGMFSFKGDLNGRHNYPGKPALNPILGILFIAGLILAIKQFSNFNNKFFLFYFLLSLIPNVMIYPWENPNMLRTFTAIPSVVYFAGGAIAEIIKKYRHKYTVFIIILFIIVSSIYEIRTYFKYQVYVFNTAFEIKRGLPGVLR